jgi:hypothetical protein
MEYTQEWERIVIYIPSSIITVYASVFYSVYCIFEKERLDEWRTTYINTNENPADLLTKMLAVGKREHFVTMLLHFIFRT